MRARIIHLAIVPFAFVLLNSCVHFKEVANYAQSSAETLDQCNHLPYSYIAYCDDSCIIYQDIKLMKSLNCNCSEASLFDSLLKVEFSVVKTYFTKMALLADPKTRMNFDPFSKTLKSGNYGRFEISSQEAQAITAVSTALSDLFTTHYKSKQLQTIIQRYHQNVHETMGYLELHLSDLIGKIQLMQSYYHHKTGELLHAEQLESGRMALIYMFQNRDNQFNSIVKPYETLLKALEKIDEGHEELYRNIKNLSSGTLKNKILSLSSDLINLHS